MTMVTSIAAPAFADAYGIALYGTHYLDQGNITVEVRGGQYYVNDVLDDDGPVIIKNHEDESDTTSVSNTITIHAEDGEANVTLKDVDIVTNGEANKSGITVKADKTKTATATVNVTLDNVTVDAREDASSEGATGGAGMTIQGNGVVNIELDGKNELLAGDGHAGLEKNRTESVGSLNINDSNEDGGSLTAIGGDGGAGIGSAITRGGFANNITISGGTVEATGGAGAAGIGDGADNVAAADSVISITGGTVTANGGAGKAAGIGNGENDARDAAVSISATNAALDVTAVTQGSGKAITGETGVTMASLTNTFRGVVRFLRGTDNYNTVHNGKYVGMEDNNQDLHQEDDAHIWGRSQIIKYATPDEQGTIRHYCSVDGCKGYYDEPYDYVEPSPDEPTPVTPVTPVTPDETPDSTPADDTTTPAEDITVTPADVADTAQDETAAVTPAGAQSTVQADTASTLPQTGVNWLAALASALSGVALLTAGLFLNRKESKH